MTRDGAAVVVAVATFMAGGAIAGLAAGEDLRRRRLPDSHTAAIAVLAVLGFAITSLVAGEGLPITDMALGAILFAGPWLAIHLIRPADLGFGDVKLTAALGLYLGWLDPSLSLYAIVISTVGFAAVLVLVKADFSESKPFGPALVAGSALAVAGSLLLGATPD